MRIVLSLYSDIPNNTTLLETKYRLPNFYEALVKSLSKYNDVLLLVNNDLIQHQHISNKALDPYVAEQYGKCIEEFNLNIIGLMSIPPFDKDSLPYFKKMNELSNNLGLTEISMGMSNDYLEAIKQGSTFIRIGSKIFGSRD